MARSGWLDVGDGQEIWWEETGAPDGIPALILHGGPGSGSSESLRDFFDPKRFRIVRFDQRQCGRSRPHAGADWIDMAVNTTWHLVEDIARLRAHLEFGRIVLYGQSWGVTLGLAYAQRYPETVRAAVFAGITTTRQTEIDWLYRGLGALLPEAYAAFRAGAGDGVDESDLLAAYHARLMSPVAAIRERAALDFHLWEGAMLLAEPGGRWPVRWDDPAYRLCRARIVTHYFVHGAWLEEGQLLAGLDKMRAIPAVLVQGMDDPQAPAETAMAVAAAWPGARLEAIEGVGHTTSGARMAEAIRRALNDFAALA